MRSAAAKRQPRKRRHRHTNPSRAVCFCCFASLSPCCVPTLRFGRSLFGRLPRNDRATSAPRPALRPRHIGVKRIKTYVWLSTGIRVYVVGAGYSLAITPRAVQTLSALIIVFGSSPCEAIAQSVCNLHDIRISDDHRGSS